MGRFKPTETQKKCIGLINRSIAIHAGAGSGKTSVLIERIKAIVESGKASLSEIVAITFTEKAAGELLYKLTRDISPKFRSQMDLATIMTIDGFCNKLLREDASLLGINPDFTVLEEHASRILCHRTVIATIKELLKDGDRDAATLVEELDFKYAVALVEELYEKRWKGDPCLRRDDILGWGDDIRDGDDIPSEREQRLSRSAFNVFGRISEKISAEKERQGAIDFADLEIMTRKLLTEHKDICGKHRSRIKHLLIDEFQDTSDLQADIIKLLFDPKKNIICIVGDPGQSIYRFRGANPDCMAEMTAFIEKSGGVRVELKENFRSQRSVIGFINQIFTAREDGNSFMPLENMADEEPFSLVAGMSVGTFEMKAKEVREAESQKIAALIAGPLADNGFNFGDIAILFRSFTDIDIYEKGLKSAGIPYYRSGGRTFLDQPEIRDLLLFLKLLTLPENDTLAYGVARSAMIGMSDEECYRLFNGRTGSIFEILCKIKKGEVLKYLQEVQKYLSIPELIKETVNRTHIHHTSGLLNGSGQPTANIEKLIVLAETISSEHECTLDEFISYMDDLKARDIGISEPPIFGTRDNAVKLLTIHAAKGLEFGAVILADIDRGDRGYSLPYIRGTAFKLPMDGNPIGEREPSLLFNRLIEEEKKMEALEKERLLYVALTRAKQALVVPFSDSSIKTAWGKIVVPPLSAIQNIDLSPLQTQNFAIPAKLGAAIPLKESPHTEGATLTVSQIESYHNCPHEYYLKYIMRLPSGRTAPRDNKMGAALIGDIVHKAIYLTSVNKDADLKKLIKLISMEYGYMNPEEEDLNKIGALLESYRQSSFESSKLDRPLHEAPFVLKVGSAVIKGTIDCVFVKDGGYSLLDFKTDTIRNDSDLPKKIEEYRLQTLAYALASRKALKKDISETTLLFLQNGFEACIKISDDELRAAEKTIEDIAQKIIKLDFNLEGSPAPCENCLYRFSGMCNRAII